jgi:hypothetical protein
MKTVEAGMADAAGLASVLMSAQAISKPRDRLPEDPPRRGEPPIGSAGFKIVKAFGDDLEPYAGTVTSVTAGLYRVMFVDGDHEELSPSEYSVALWMALARPDLLARGEARAFRGTCVLVTCNEERSPLGQAFGAGGISSSKFCSRGCRCAVRARGQRRHLARRRRQGPVLLRVLRRRRAPDARRDVRRGLLRPARGAARLRAVQVRMHAGVRGGGRRERAEAGDP